MANGKGADLERRTTSLLGGEIADLLKEDLETRSQAIKMAYVATTGF